MRRCRIEEGEKFVELVLYETYIIFEAGDGRKLCHYASLSLPKALELHKAMGKLLGVEDKLLEACKQLQTMGEEILVKTNFISIEACRSYVEEMLEFCKAKAAIKDAEETT